jgi:hypothetical protein
MPLARYLAIFAFVLAAAAVTMALALWFAPGLTQGGETGRWAILVALAASAGAITLSRLR